MSRRCPLLRGFTVFDILFVAYAWYSRSTRKPYCLLYTDRIPRLHIVAFSGYVQTPYLRLHTRYTGYGYDVAYSWCTTRTGLASSAPFNRVETTWLPHQNRIISIRGLGYEKYCLNNEKLIWFHTLCLLEFVFTIAKSLKFSLFFNFKIFCFVSLNSTYFYPRLSKLMEFEQKEIFSRHFAQFTGQDKNNQGMK